MFVGNKVLIILFFLFVPVSWIFFKFDSVDQSEIKDIEQEQSVNDNRYLNKKNQKKKINEYKTIMTSFFWVGEGADEDNAYISNESSAWDSYWMDSYGGVDDSDDRCGFRPCSFIPQENPFYFALPYNDLNEDDEAKERIIEIPWYGGYKENKSILKNRWIEIVYQDKKCFAQWEDVGPNNEDDFEYVFGEKPLPENQFGVKAGLDVSPAVRDCLEMMDNDCTKWKFVADEEVLEGPWKETITVSDVRR